MFASRSRYSSTSAVKRLPSHASQVLTTPVMNARSV